MSKKKKSKKKDRIFDIFKPMLKSKKGYSTGFAWIFGLVTLFGLGVLYVIFTQVFDVYLVPVIKSQVNNSYSNIDPATVAEVNNNIDTYMSYFHLLPYILFFVVVIYMVLVAVRKEREGEFG
jgi:hypothetical protein